MKFGWNKIKISIAGARLSHLVQKDSIWDHGSMIEQVKTVFIYLKKAFLKSDPLVVKKCVTREAYKKMCEEMVSKNISAIGNAELLTVEITSVIPAKHNRTDMFRALVKLKELQEAGFGQPAGYHENGRVVEEEWLFLREGNWWLLHQIKR